MQILFAISILSLAVLIMAGVAIARHIRIGRPDALPATDHDFSHHLFAAVREPSMQDTGSRMLRSVPAQTVKSVMANKSWNQPAGVVTLHPDPEAHLAYEELANPSPGERKAPQSTHDHERLDWAYFNKDLCDLSDPYQAPRLQAPRLRANSRNDATSPNHY